MSDFAIAPVYRGAHRTETRRDSVLLLWLDGLILTLEKFFTRRKIAMRKFFARRMAAVRQFLSQRRPKRVEASQGTESYVILQKPLKADTVALKALEDRYEPHTEVQEDFSLPFRLWDTEKGLYVGGLYPTRDQAIIARAEMIAKTVPATEAERLASLTALARYLSRLAGPTQSAVLSGSGGMPEMFTSHGRVITLTLTTQLADKLSAIIAKDLTSGY